MRMSEPTQQAAAGRLPGAVRAVAILSRHFERQCLEIGLSLPQYRLLLFVRRGPQRAAELAAQASVRRPTLTALVDGLEKEGLLVRRAVEGDRRGIRLELTSKGSEMLDRAETHLCVLLERMLKHGEAERVLGGLEELLVVLDRSYRATTADPAAGAPGSESSSS
jgi:DNA-binding MarR family transcriptional regulator